MIFDMLLNDFQVLRIIRPQQSMHCFDLIPYTEPEEGVDWRIHMQNSSRNAFSTAILVEKNLRRIRKPYGIAASIAGKPNLFFDFISRCVRCHPNNQGFFLTFWTYHIYALLEIAILN